jgi:hypothetical protein
MNFQATRNFQKSLATFSCTICTTLYDKVNIAGKQIGILRSLLFVWSSASVVWPGSS